MEPGEGSEKPKKPKKPKKKGGGGCGCSCLGCLGVVLAVLFFWALLFGVTVGGVHYGISGCGVDQGVRIDVGDRR